MEKRKPLVSFLIPCYNHEKFVADCLNSIYSQTCTDYEVILCDDCSRDQSLAVIRTWEKPFQEQNIRFVVMENEQNMGITKNLNRMLKEAQGKYIKVIASDDILAETYLEEMVPLMEQNPAVKLLFSDGYKFQEDASYPVKKEFYLCSLLEGAPDCHENVFARIYLCNFVPAPALLIRHDVLKEVGGYDENIKIEDLEILLRILERYPDGLEVYPKKLVFYRVNANSVTSVSNNAGVKQRLRNMRDNSLIIARKYKNSVSKKNYRKRVREIHLSYIFAMRRILMS